MNEKPETTRPILSGKMRELWDDCIARGWTDHQAAVNVAAKWPPLHPADVFRWATGRQP